MDHFEGFIHGGRTMRFLVVDDDRAILTLIDNVIFGLGHEAVLAESEAEADAIAEPIDGVVVDWHLHDKTCAELTGRLKDRFPGVPIMMITGDSDLNLIQQALELGVQDWWFKPTGVANLQKQLKGMFATAARVRSERNTPRNDAA